MTENTRNLSPPQSVFSPLCYLGRHCAALLLYAGRVMTLTCKALLSCRSGPRGDHFMYNPHFMESLLLCIKDEFKRPFDECLKTVSITQKRGLGPAVTSQMLLYKISSKPQQLSVLLCCLAPGIAGLGKC